MPRDLSSSVPLDRNGNTSTSGARMPSIEENLVKWDEEYGWSTGGDEWSGAWGNASAQWYGCVFPRIRRFLPARSILEIAPGFGRWTRFLLDHCDNLIGVVEFLADLVDQTPEGLDLHCIVDNFAAHKTPTVTEFLAANQHVHLHFTPTHASWLNQVELFFSILERRLLRGGEFDSVDHLAERVIAFIKDYNRKAAPFRWTYDGRPLRAA